MIKSASLHQIKNNAYVEFVKFSLVGAVNTSVDLGAYIFMTRMVLYFSEHILIAKAIAFVFATISSFALNRTWTFNKKDKVKFNEVLRFYSTVGTGIFINVGAVYFFHEILGFHDITSALIATAFTVFWGFAFSKFWVFKK